MSALYGLLEEDHEAVSYGLSQHHFEVTGDHPQTLQQWVHQHAAKFQ